MENGYLDFKWFLYHRHLLSQELPLLPWSLCLASPSPKPISEPSLSSEVANERSPLLQGDSVHRIYRCDAILLVKDLDLGKVWEYLPAHGSLASCTGRVAGILRCCSVFRGCLRRR